MESPRPRYATTAFHQSVGCAAVNAPSATGAAAPTMTTAAALMPRARRVQSRYATMASRASSADCLTMSAEPERIPAVTSHVSDRVRRKRTNARRPSVAGSDAMSSPASVNDSMNGDAPTVASRSAAALPTMLPPNSMPSRMTASTTRAPTTAARARMRAGEPPRSTMARYASTSPCGRSTQTVR